jgi:glycosyltransferase involved in cell wall biosynthesis
MNEHLVSIVMPAYKAHDTLAMAVKGIQSQSHEGWELLLLLDGEHEQDIQIAKSLAAADSRIQLCISSKNRGVVRMRNLGIRLAKGTWLAFCDADDVWVPNKLKWQLQAADAVGASLVCSSFWYWHAKEKGEFWREVKLPARLDASIMLRTNAIPMSTAMINIGQLGKQYFSPMPEGLIHEDYDFWLRIMLEKQPRAVTLAQPTTLIRVAPHSRSANKWLALKSHAHILKSRAQLHGLPQWYHLGHYLFWGVWKRWSGKKWLQHPVM